MLTPPLGCDMSLGHHGWPADGPQPDFISVTSQRQPRFLVPTRGRSFRPAPHPCCALLLPSHGGQDLWCRLRICSAMSRDRMSILHRKPSEDRACGAEGSRPGRARGGFSHRQSIHDFDPAHRAGHGPGPLHGRSRDHCWRRSCGEVPRHLQRTTGVAPSGTIRNIQVITAGGVRRR